MDEFIPVALLATLSVMVAIASITLLSRMREKRIRDAENHLRRGRATYFLDEGDSARTCDICLGPMTDDDVAECPCGKSFHEACARPTEACPYCGKPYGEMRVRSPRKPRCPVCGRYVRGSMCACGAVLPRSDNTFVCSCGNRVDATSPVCSVCGAKYAKTAMEPRGKAKKHRGTGVRHGRQGEERA